MVKSFGDLIQRFFNTFRETSMFAGGQNIGKNRRGVVKSPKQMSK